MKRTFPEHYMITGKFTDPAEFTRKLEAALESGSKIVQLRCKQISDPAEYLQLAQIAERLCQKHHAILLLATSVDLFQQSQADGLHLNSQVLEQYQSRPIADDKLLSVSCHTLADLQHASKLGADIMLLSPVKETSSHPGVAGIGWEKFSEMIATIEQPVYALGGMNSEDLTDAKQAGAQGIAAISSFWK